MAGAFIAFSDYLYYLKMVKAAFVLFVLLRVAQRAVSVEKPATAAMHGQQSGPMR